MAEKNIRLDIQYEGTAYSGWQYQPNAVTIQGKIEEAIHKITGQKVSVHAAGRTDAGVHALGQVANFRIEHHIPPAQYKEALNFYLPKDILITVAAEAVPDFHARRSAIWREYKYVIGLKRTALYYNLRWEYGFPLNLDRMNELAGQIIGIHDFSAFCVVSSQKENNDCQIFDAGWRKHADMFTFEIRANRFLHTMVRSLVGTMVDAGKEKDYLTLEQFKDIFNAYDHTKILTVAPARGLFLKQVGY